MAGSDRLCSCGCGASLSGLRSDARYYSDSCRKRAQRAYSTDKGRTRRQSRNGSGTRIYLTGREIDLLERALTKQTYVMQGAKVPLPKVSESVLRLRTKLGRAAERASW